MYSEIEFDNNMFRRNKDKWGFGVIVGSQFYMVFKKTYKIIYDKNFVEDFLDQYDNKFGDLEQGVLALIIRCSN